MIKFNVWLLLAGVVLASSVVGTGADAETVAVNSASGGNPSTVAWSSTLNDFVSNNNEVPINSISPPAPPGTETEGDFDAFLLPINLTDTPVVTVTSSGSVYDLAPSSVNQVGQAYGLFVADAIARGSVDTGADLFYQALMRIDTLTPTAIVLNAMVEEVGCRSPLVDTLAAAYRYAEDANVTAIFSLALRSVPSPIGSLGSCLETVTNPSSAQDAEEAAAGPASAPTSE